MKKIKYSYELHKKDLSPLYYKHYRVTIKIINNKLFLTNFYGSSNSSENVYQINKIIENYEKVKEIITNILKYKDFKTENEQIIQSINSKIILYINNNLGVYNVYYKNKDPKFSIEIKEKETTIKSESLELYHYLSENLDNIKEQLYFRKIDCPIWMQE